MSDNVRIDVSGDRAAGLRFEEFPDALYDDLRREIDSLTGELYMMIRSATPSESGRLRSQERQRLFTDKTRITGMVDIEGQGTGGKSDFAKAAALEYGAHKPGKVAAHSMKLGHLWADKLAAPLTVMVDAFMRTPNQMEHSFLRGPLAAMRPRIVERLNSVVEKATEAANA